MTAAVPTAVLLNGRPVAILKRRPNPWASTFPSEVLTCECETLGPLEILCKRSGGRRHPAFGHRRGVEYEAAVYRDVLASLPLSQPVFYGATTDDEDTCIFLEYLGEGAGVDEAAMPAEALRRAARWIGTFHAANQDRVASLPGLVRYNSAYYAQWPERLAAMAGDWHRRLPWLGMLCERSCELAAQLLSQPVTVVHGEFSPSNVLLRGDLVCPVDWESAAIGPGEIDLVALIENWPPELANDCIREYQAARWTGPPPSDFEQRLDLAWMYWHFRWLGERSDWLTEAHVLGRASHLRQIGERLGWL